MQDQVKTDTGYNYGGTSYKNEQRTDSQGNKYTVAIPISSVTTAPQPQFQTPAPQTPTNYNAMTADIATPYDFAVQNYQQQQANATGDVAGLMNTLAGKSAFEAQQNEATGLNKANEEAIKKAAEISALGKQSAAAQQENISQGRQLGSVSSFVAGQANEIERNRAIKALSLGAELDAIQGNIAVAQSKVKQAVDAQYADKELALANKLKMFELNQSILGNLTSQQQTAFNQAKYKVEQEQKRLDAEKATRLDTENLITEAIPNAPANVIAKAKQLAQKGASKMEVAQALGVYGGDYLGNQVKKAQLQKLGLENKKAIQELYDKASTGGLKTLSYEENAKFNSTPQVKAINDANKYAMAVQNYKDAINKYGTGEVMGTGSGALGQAYSAVVGAVKDYYNLGTLDNGVQKLVDLGIPAPSVLGQKSARIGALDEAIGEASKTLKVNIDQLSSTAYKNSNEFKNLVDNSSSVLMTKMTNEELLASIPGASGSMGTNTSTNQTFFNK